MVASEVARLERENEALRLELMELGKRMEQDTEKKPKACKYCRKYIQHYGKFNGSYSPINAGHCISGMKNCKGGKRKPNPDDSCPYFELGAYVGVS